MSERKGSRRTWTPSRLERRLIQWAIALVMTALFVYDVSRGREWAALIDATIAVFAARHALRN